MESTNDAKRRASDALLEALDEGWSLLEVVELAMDDVEASEGATRALARDHDRLQDSRRSR